MDGFGDQAGVEVAAEAAVRGQGDQTDIDPFVFSFGVGGKPGWQV